MLFFSLVRGCAENASLQSLLVLEKESWPMPSLLPRVSTALFRARHGAVFKELTLSIAVTVSREQPGWLPLSSASCVFP